MLSEDYGIILDDADSAKSEPADLDNSALMVRIPYHELR